MAVAAEFRLAPAAEHDLEGIWAYSVQSWGVEQANRYIDTLNAVFAELARSPSLRPPAITSDQATAAEGLSGT